MRYFKTNRLFQMSETNIQLSKRSSADSYPNNMHKSAVSLLMYLILGVFQHFLWLKKQSVFAGPSHFSTVPWDAMLYLLCASDVKFALRHSGDVKAPSGFTRVSVWSASARLDRDTYRTVCLTSRLLLKSPAGWTRLNGFSGLSWVSGGREKEEVE